MTNLTPTINYQNTINALHDTKQANKQKKTTINAS